MNLKKHLQRLAKGLAAAILVVGGMSHDLAHQKVGLNGKWVVDHVRDGEVIGHYPCPNDITNEGKNTLFNVMFNTATQIANSSWFIGLISNSGYSALAATDVMSSHSGWTEFIGYSGGARPAWGSGSSTSQSVTNASPATFNINASGTILGIFVVANSTLSGTTGPLWSTALFGASVPVTNGDQLRATYTVSA